jgi:hypothetical protein
MGQVNDKMVYPELVKLDVGTSVACGRLNLSHAGWSVYEFVGRP